MADLFHAAMVGRDSYSEEQRSTARKYRELERLLKENLADVKVYKVGEINIPVYVVGRGAENWIGVSTRVVET